MCLHAEFHPHFESNLILVQFLKSAELGRVLGIIYIHNGHLLRFSRAAAAVFHPFRIIPVPFDPVIHMIRETDLGKAKRDRVFYNFLHRILGIIAVFGMNVIICQHSVLPSYILLLCSADLYFTLSRRVITGNFGSLSYCTAV